jgi:hypothetical protein
MKKSNSFTHAVRWCTVVRAFYGCLVVSAAQWVMGPMGSAQTAYAAGAGSATSDATASRDAEIALALSACPPSVAPGAAVYVFGKAGYVKAREGRNGFTAIVQHSVPTAQEPRCMDAEGTRTWLPRILMIAELRARGKSRAEIQRSVADALARGVLKTPSRPGVDYMLSTQNRVPNARGIVTPFPPHVMFYAPHLTNAEIGVDDTHLGADGNPVGPAFVAAEGTPYALIIVPVGRHDTMSHSMPDLAPGAQ